MYGRGAMIGVVSAATTTTAVATLPNTGGNIVVTIAVSVAVGLISWGALYLRSN